MKIAWTILLISAVTDFVINAGTALGAAIVATGQAEIPNNAVLLLATIGGLVAAARTIQGALKTTPESQAALRGAPTTTSTASLTTTEEKTPGGN